MNIISKFAWKLSLCAVLFIAAGSAKADFWRWTKPFVGPDQKIQTLIVTGNYAESRLLAELIQEGNRQPILLFPASNSVNQDIFFMPPYKSSAALQIPSNELTNFVNFLGAEQIVILGNSKFVSDKYIEKIKNNQVTWRISGDNWKKVAASVGLFMNILNLADDYNSLLDKLRSEVNYQRVGDQTNIAPVEQQERVLEIVPTDNDADMTLSDEAPDGATLEIIDASQK